jgi:ankyrin repeat protein
MASNAHSVKMMTLLLENGANPNFTSKTQIDSPLHKVACSRIGDDHIPCFELLIHAGADVNSRDFMNKTPLYLTIYKFNFDATTFLLQHGADPNIIFEEKYLLTRFSETGISKLAAQLEPYMDRFSSENLAKYKSLRLQALLN